MCQGEGVTAPLPSPAAPPPADDSKVASTAWAVAVIVVALVAGLIAWLALGNGGGQQNAAPSQPAPTQQTQPAEPGAGEGGQAEEPQEAEPPSEEVQQIMLDLQRRDPADLMAAGDVDAPVVMIEYADYRCPYCARFALETRPGLQPLIDAGVLRLEFRDFVIFDEQSHAAAVAARAAAAQGLLDAYQTAVFARSADGRGELAREDLMDLAAEVGVPDLEAFEAALDDPELAAAVDADTEEARTIGLSSTPTFFVNTSVVQGAQSLEHFEAIIAEEAAKVSAD